MEAARNGLSILKKASNHLLKEEAVLTTFTRMILCGPLLMLLFFFPQSQSNAAEAEPEQSRKLRDEFMARVRHLDELAKRKESIVQKYIQTGQFIDKNLTEVRDLDDKIHKFNVASNTDLSKLKTMRRRASHLSKEIEISELEQSYYVKSYRTVTKREEIAKACADKQITKAECAREMQAQDDTELTIDKLISDGRLLLLLTKALSAIELQVSSP